MQSLLNNGQTLSFAMQIPLSYFGTICPWNKMNFVYRTKSEIVWCKKEEEKCFTNSFKNSNHCWRKPKLVSICKA